MRAILLIVMFLTTSYAFAEDWKQLNSEEITTALTDKEIVYKNQRNSSQTFYANGETGFVDGRPSLGNWRVENNQYCSQWPPSTTWACYDVYLHINGTIVRFLGDDEINWDGTYR